MAEEYIAHVRDTDQRVQTVAEHLLETAALARAFASKLGIPDAGELVGLVHDLGKHSKEFQDYIRSATDLLDPDEDEEVIDAERMKGKVDHSTAGAQHVWRGLSGKGQLGEIIGQIASLCVASHHSGLIDCLITHPSEGVKDDFSRRMSKSEEKSHLGEVIGKADERIATRVQAILKDNALIGTMKKVIASIINSSPEKDDKEQVAQLKIGLLVRFLFSCLIDADRQSSADFEKPRAAKGRQLGRYTSWEELVARLETHLEKMLPLYPIDETRREVSSHCLAAAQKEKGIFTLTVPTGGGKTLASLRFALHHVSKHSLDRIVFVLPFTTIIDQNADVVRKILEPADVPEEHGRVVLEHHSNLGPEVQGWREKLLTENWDAPVVYTTSVQFLEALFGRGTRGARRMHQLARAVIIFDEIQSLPIRCVHLFNNAINFLVDQCGSTVVLCTATQPLLGRVDSKKGAARLTESSEIIPDVQRFFDALERVRVVDQRKDAGWSETEIVELAIREAGSAGSCLVVVNTKKSAKALYRSLQQHEKIVLFHLSTSMCPAHRRRTLREIQVCLGREQPVICVSTQLIEAGVDIDFGAVIRFSAGLDSVAQAAGRCNRNGRRSIGYVYIVNPAEENLQSLDDIRVGKERAERVQRDFHERPANFPGGLIGPAAMNWYYENYFFARKDQMDYPVKADRAGRDDTLLSLLSSNTLAMGEYERRYRKMPAVYLRQSFMTAANAFQVIDTPTQGVVVPFDKEGNQIIAELCSRFEVEKQHALLHRAQQYTVNVFPNEFRRLQEEGALNEIQKGTRIYCLSQAYYSTDFGLSTEPVAKEDFLNA